MAGIEGMAKSNDSERRPSGVSGVEVEAAKRAEAGMKPP
jgi:hypothetical protein